MVKEEETYVSSLAWCGKCNGGDGNKVLRIQRSVREGKDKIGGEGEG